MKDHKDHAALMLIEILAERDLVNKETLDAVREKIKSTNHIHKMAHPEDLKIEGMP